MCAVPNKMQYIRIGFVFHRIPNIYVSPQNLSKREIFTNYLAMILILHVCMWYL